MRLLLAIAIPFLLLVCGFPLLTRKGWPGKLTLVALYLPIALSPCVIPVRKPLPRAVAAVNGIILAVKLFDVRRDVRRGITPGRGAAGAGGSGEGSKRCITEMLDRDPPAGAVSCRPDAPKALHFRGGGVGGVVRRRVRALGAERKPP